jgi:hypothetical protein
MDMNFPHKSISLETNALHSCYDAIVGAATLRQMGSPTLRALQTASKSRVCKSDAYDSRLAFFAQKSTEAGVGPFGAFWPRKSEDVVNCDSSVILKFDSLDVGKPDLQVKSAGHGALR